MQPSSNELHAKAVDLTGELQQAKAKITELEMENKDLLRQVAQLKKDLYNALLGKVKLRSGLRYLPKPDTPDGGKTMP
jgi:FtsZ-binding cell division protein ZapB